jgi:hypothetical protein
MQRWSSEGEQLYLYTNPLKVLDMMTKNGAPTIAVPEKLVFDVPRLPCEDT